METARDDPTKRILDREYEIEGDVVYFDALDPDRLKDAGIQAIYGNAVYKKLRPGVIYVFKISNTGQVYPETVPDL